MKAILVIDMPEEYMGSDIDVRLYGKNQTIHERYVNKLRPMPNRMPFDEAFKMEDYVVGWNACLDEILGETE